MTVAELTDPMYLATEKLIFDTDLTEEVEIMNKTLFFNAISMVSTLNFPI